MQIIDRLNIAIFLLELPERVITFFEVDGLQIGRNRWPKKLVEISVTQMILPMDGVIVVVYDFYCVFCAVRVFFGWWWITHINALSLSDSYCGIVMNEMLLETVEMS